MPTDFDAAFEQRLAEQQRRGAERQETERLEQERLKVAIPTARQNIQQFIEKMRAHGVQPKPVFELHSREIRSWRFWKTETRNETVPTGTFGWQFNFPGNYHAPPCVITEDGSFWDGEWAYSLSRREQIFIRGLKDSYMLQFLAHDDLVAQIAATLVNPPRPL